MASRPPASSGQSRSRSKSESTSTSTQTQYLITYNLTSAILWAGVLLRTVMVAAASSAGYTDVYPQMGQFVKWTQTLAVLEVLHSAAGLVRSPLPTTVMQVSSRLLLVWLIVDRFPAATSSSPFYTSMLLAWSVTEVIRYGYFVALLASSTGQVPAWLAWLRYNTFFVLYPLGITSECALVWIASGVVPVEWARYALWAVLVAYVPGAWVLYGHMMAQRRRVMRGKGTERKMR